MTRRSALAPGRAARIARTAWAATWALVFLDATAVVAQPAAGSTAERRRALIARADSLQLPGSWTPPAGDPLAHHTAGFATTLCAAVFITGLDPQDAAANVGFFTGPLEFRRSVARQLARGGWAVLVCGAWICRCSGSD